MEGLMEFEVWLNNLQWQTEALTEAAVCLDKFLAVETDKLSRSDKVKQLRMMQGILLKDLERLERLESAARYADSEFRLGYSLTALAAKFIVVEATENQRTRNLVNRVIDAGDSRKRTYGTVRICVGLEGLPDDVRAISISELARKSTLTELRIIEGLREHGCILFKEESFCRLIDKLAIEIGEGRLDFPMGREKLRQIWASVNFVFETKKFKWVRIV